MVECTNCKEQNKFGTKYCVWCGEPLPGTKKRSRPRLAAGETATRTASDELKPWTILALILASIGAFVSFMGFWIVGIPLMIAAGYFAYTQGSNITPRITILLSMVALYSINIIPENRLISAVGFTIAWMSIILTLPTKEASNKFSYKIKGIIPVGAVAVGTTVLWTIISLTGTADQTSILIMTLVNALLVCASIIWKQPIDYKWKLIGSFILLLPLIIYGVRFLFIYGAASWGQLVDRAQVMFTQDLGLSGTALDMILNPTLAVQAGLKPATQKEVTETAGPPSLAFTVSGSVIPESGCYDDSSFQVIARVSNSGGEYIKDLDLAVVHKQAEPFLLDILPNPCKAEYITDDCDSVGPWKDLNLPQGVTISRQCLVTSIQDTGDVVQIPGMEVTPSHTCFFDIVGSTGYHSVSRLPVELIENEYGRNKFEQRQLVQRVVPSVTSTGPVDLSLGGFEQPILHTNETNKVTMITTITKSGPGFIDDYKSAYLFIPNDLLDGGECSGINDDWECVSSVPKESSDCADLESTHAEYHCNRFRDFMDDEEIGGFTQFEYDNSDDLLDEDYSICFFEEDINPTSVITTGTCTLTISKNALTEDDLRKTLIIRGDVLYTYHISVPLGISVRDCDI